MPTLTKIKGLIWLVTNFQRESQSLCTQPCTKSAKISKRQPSERCRHLATFPEARRDVDVSTK